ncbi:MAG: CHAT domain-containing protein [Leptolyngbyaceae bacterium]|nr:CHAT domain-containing protein [Leptolyngbyaceae bacterium]
MIATVRAQLKNFLIAGILLFGVIEVTPVKAQFVAPAADNDTGTQVNIQNNGLEATIDGGMLSSDGANLFHSFQQFGLNADQVATFLANPSIQNILGRVVGGTPSVIDGLIQVSGSGNPNLYLLNPAGMIFGPNASLNVPAAFMASSANALGFSSGWFNTVGANNYAQLSGSPTDFAFSTAQPGVILNAGSLSVTEGQHLHLSGGWVINTGTLEAPGGTITIAAVPGNQLVRVSQAGSLLSLDLPVADQATLSSPGQPITALSLPDLLTGGHIPTPDAIAIDAEGVIKLVSTQQPISDQPGTIASSGFILADSDGGMGGNITLLADGDMTLGGIVGSYGLTGGGSVSLTSLNGSISVDWIDSFSTDDGSGGDITLQAFQDLSVNYLSSYGWTGGGNLSLTSETGAISVGAIDSYSDVGSGGDITLNASQDLSVNYLSSYGWTGGGNLSLTSQTGAISVGWIDSYSDAGSGGNITLHASQDLSISDLSSYGWSGGGAVSLLSTQGSIDTSGGIIGSYSDIGNAGSVNLEASGNITTGYIQTYTFGDDSTTGGNITLTSHNGLINTTLGDLSYEAAITDDADIASPEIANLFQNELANLDAYAPDGTGGTINLSAPLGITTSHISSFGGVGSGNVSLFSSQGDINTGVIFSVTQTETGGNISVQANQGSATIQHIATYSTQGIGGTVGVQAGGAIALNNVASFGNQQSGNVVLSSTGGSINTGFVKTVAPSGTSGSIKFNTFSIGGDIQTANLTSAGGFGSQNITVVAANGSIITGDLASLGGEGQGGGISVEGKGNVTTGNITATGALGSGDITLISHQGQVQTGALYTRTGRIDIKTAAGSILSQVNAASRTASQAVAQLEEDRGREFSNHFGPSFQRKALTTAEIRQTLVNIARQTGDRSAVVYVNLPVTQTKQVKSATGSPNASKENRGEELELIVFTPDREPVRIPIPGVTTQRVLQVVNEFRGNLITSLRRHNTRYLQPSQQLYEWLIAPLESELKAHQINTILFSMDSGLRSLPIAALHDGKQYLVEKYNLALVPTISLVNPEYRSLADAQVLAMGASNFTDLEPLPAVPAEVGLITQIWKGSTFLNEDFTRPQLVQKRQTYPYPIIHLATHAEFNPGSVQNSYIQLWNEKLRLDQIQQLGWNNPPVELLVLSACRTAIGNPQAELGFAGLSVASGAKTALASLWSVSDEGTFSLMTEFYQQLRSAKVKGAALRQAQLAMLSGKLQIQQGQLRGSSTRGAVALPAELATLTNTNLAHPYYWSGFTLIGSPW